MDYITEHRTNVIKAFNNLFAGKTLSTYSISEQEFDLAIRSIANDIKNHDESKYSDDEFYAYRQKFFPTDNELKMMQEDSAYALKIEEDFKIAWKHHFTTNDHHPKYWKVINGEFNEDNEPTDMSLGAIIHAICDWEAMSMKFGGNTLDWFNTKADDEKSYMTERTLQIFTEILDLLFNK